MIDRDMLRTVIICAGFVSLAVFTVALARSLTLLHNRTIGFVVLPACLVPALVLAAVLAAAIVKHKANAVWFLLPTIAASLMLGWFVQFLMREYRNHGHEAVGQGSEYLIMLLIAFGAGVAFVYVIPVAAFFLWGRK